MVIFELNFHPSIDGFQKNTIIVKFQKIIFPSIDGSHKLVKLYLKNYPSIDGSSKLVKLYLKYDPSIDGSSK